MLLYIAPHGAIGSRLRCLEPYYVDPVLMQTLDALLTPSAIAFNNEARGSRFFHSRGQYLHE